MDTEGNYPSFSLFSCHFTRVEFTPTIHVDILQVQAEPLNGINYNQNPPESLSGLIFSLQEPGWGEEEEEEEK